MLSSIFRLSNEKNRTSFFTEKICRCFEEVQKHCYHECVVNDVKAGRL